MPVPWSWIDSVISPRSVWTVARRRALDLARQEQGRRKILDQHRPRQRDVGPSAQGVRDAAEVAPVVTERPAVHLDGVLSGPGGPYRLMISSHRFERDALMESAETERRGVASEVVPAEIAERGTWYRVVVSGGYPRLAAAREVLDIVKGLGYEGAWIERTQGSN